MPDWSYLPLFRPLLDRLGPRRGRATALRAMGTLASLPLGARFVELFGDLAPEPRSRTNAGGIAVASRVGAGAGLDVALTGARALARLGVGFCEIGPVTRVPVRGGAVRRDDREATICYEEPLENPGLAAFERLSLETGGPARIAFRIAFARGAKPADAAREVLASLDHLAPRADFFTLDLRAGLEGGWSAADAAGFVATIANEAAALPSPRPLLLCLPPDGDEAAALDLAALAIGAGFAGVSVCGGVAREGRALVGAPTLALSVRRVRALRARLGPVPVIIGSGGIHAPADALAFVEAGATLVQLHSGFVLSGPALARRINDALIARTEPATRGLAEAPARRPVRWMWGAVYGAALVFTSLLVMLVGMTRVVLPYDEAYLGMTRGKIAGFDVRLLPFMVHDRVTAAGTLLSLAMMYVALAAFGIRRGERWAWRAIAASSVPGFLSFWLWLRLGYFEPLHALATVALLPLFAGMFFTTMGDRPPRVVDRNDVAWRRSLIAQLLLVVTGTGQLIGGLTIAFVGTTSVFVQTDLDYLGTTVAAIDAANRHLEAVIAHDRAEFGGALAAYGLVLLMTTLWGFRRGERWLWWALALGGVPGFASTLVVHAAIGYTQFWHLAPVFFALGLYAAALVLSRAYLCEAASA